MSKSLALTFAITSVLLMLATAFTINYSGWVALLLGVLTCANIAFGFTIKAKRSKSVPKA